VAKRPHFAEMWNSVCRWRSVCADPVLKILFFVIFVLVMRLGVKPAQFYDFIHAAGDCYSARLIARKFAAIDFDSVCHESPP
jgi:hypothetical protein